MDLLSHKVLKHQSSGEWIVLIHGMGGSSAVWFKQIKEYRKYYNLLLIDLPGHGSSTWGLRHIKSNISMTEIAKEVLDVLDAKGISQAHFVGISLGTIVVQMIHSISPKRVKSMVLGGAVEWIYSPMIFVAPLVNGLKYFIPYMWIYKFAAWFLMPKERHREARRSFVQEAVKLGQKEFFCWFRLLYKEINTFFKIQKPSLDTPTLYIMGGDDFMFLPVLKERLHKIGYSCLRVLERCGHLCNLDQDKKFNELSLDFIKSHSNESLRLQTI